MSWFSNFSLEDLSAAAAAAAAAAQEGVARLAQEATHLTENLSTINMQVYRD
jgi:hypothetical protein